MWYDLKYLIPTIMQFTGMAVWAAILAYVIVFMLLYNLIYLGFGSSLSYHRWVLRTDHTRSRPTLGFWLLSLLRGAWYMRGHRHMNFHYRSINGGYWRNMWDHADSFQHRVERGEVEVVEEKDDNGFGEGVTA